MLTDILVAMAATAAATILWRTFKDDHPRFKKWLATVPFIGEALSCGICLTFWFSLITLVIARPFGDYSLPLSEAFAPVAPFIHFAALWLAFGMGVLLIRTLAIVLLELGGKLKHEHQARHARVEASSH